MSFSTLAKRLIDPTIALALQSAAALAAASPQPKLSTPGFYRMMLGEVEITVLLDTSNNLPCKTNSIAPNGSHKR